jgi:ribonucleoside-diphosphate reductase alpha chain
MAIERIKKRNGTVVDFDRSRIATAMAKAFAATRVAVSREVLESMTDAVISELETAFLERIPGVEDVQDIVEKTLAARGHFDVAKAYILYRREHAALRENRRTQILERIRRRDLMVKKRSGTLARFDLGEIETAIANCCRGHEGAADVSGIVHDTQLALYDGIPTSEINQAIIMAIRERIPRSSSTTRCRSSSMYRRHRRSFTRGRAARR